jgi:hypothetical protein
MNRHAVAALSLVVVLAGAGQGAALEPEGRKGVVIIVGGVGGFDILGPAALAVLPKVGIEHELREFVWTHGFGQWLQDLQDARHQFEKAYELAEHVRKIKDEEPDRPVYLVGKSGGTGIVLSAASMLRTGTLERIILLSSAVSPAYDLRPAFRATRHEIVNYWSAGDWFILGWGTKQFGTMDRVHGAAAGLTGFVKPTEGDDLDLYDRLVQVQWKSDMIKTGHTGGHVGTSFPAFVAKEVAPWLK